MMLTKDHYTCYINCDDNLTIQQFIAKKFHHLIDDFNIIRLVKEDEVWYAFPYKDSLADILELSNVYEGLGESKVVYFKVNDYKYKQYNLYKYDELKQINYNYK